MANDNVIGLNLMYSYALYEFDVGDNLIYRGYHYTHGAATSDANWHIWKYSYTDGNLTSVERLVGAWDNRASLAWV